MPKPPPDWIEQHYDEDLVASGAALFQYKLVEFVMSERGIKYQFLVKDGNDYTVDLSYPFFKKQSSHCECAYFLSQGDCPHIVAGLYYLQDQLADKEPEPQSILDIKADHKKLTKINIGQILESVSHRDLIDFIRETARKDAKLSLAIKVHFARKIELADDIDKYKSILNAIIKPITGTTTKLSVADVRSLLYVLDDFHGQMMDCLALGQYMEAFHIFVASFDKLQYTKHHSKVLIDKLMQMSVQYHDAIVQFLREKLAPELRVSFVQYLVNMCGRSYYNFEDIKANIVYQVSTFKKRQDTPLLLGICESERIKTSTFSEEIFTALSISLKNKIDIETLKRIENKKCSISNIVDYLEQIMKPDLALSLLKTVIKRNKKIDRDIAFKLIRMYIMRNAWDDLTSHCLYCATETLDLDFIDAIKKHISPERYIGILHKLEDNVQSIPTAQHMLLKIYVALEDINAIVNICRDNIEDLAKIQACEQMMYGHNPEILAEIYLLHIAKYLDTHAGDNAYIYLNEMRYHIQKSKLDKMIIPIVSMLSNKYNHRPKLAKSFALLT
jgi:hypothetical protein